MNSGIKFKNKTYFVIPSCLLDEVFAIYKNKNCE